MIRARDVLGPGSALSHQLAGYEDRPGQTAMAEAVEDALAHDRALFVEAGTGTGKTLAYLVPAILSGRKVIVSTATRALQEQIFTKDLPIVRSILAPYGVEFKAALMKGLGNYVCRRRLHELLSSADGAHVGGDRDLSAIAEWVKATPSGDRADLASVAEDAPAWGLVQSSSDTRIGAGCSYFDECFVTRMRREAEDATIVVVNHHLFFADLALRYGRGAGEASALPPYDSVVFDEAHQIEEIATDFFGVRVSSTRVDALVRDARRAFTGAKLLSALGTGDARPLLDGVASKSAVFFGALGGRSAGPAQEARRILSDRDLDGAVRSAHAELDGALDGLWAYALAHDRDEAVSVIARRARDLRTDLRSILSGSRANREGEVSASVAWLDLRERSVSLGASPVDLGPTLREALFDRVPGVVCTSATLTTGVDRAGPRPDTPSGGDRAGLRSGGASGDERSGGGPGASFHFVRARLGAPPEARELVVPSPFDIPARAALYVPRDLPEPGDPAFEGPALERIVELVAITRGGAFVLCTSTRAMKSFHRALRPRITHPLLMQGEAPKHQLLSRFRASGHAVLVATLSFWEGVDVPGHALRLVILDKIPFAVPTDPVVAARCAQIEREGGNPFVEYSVPVAAITLKQGFGRLLRTRKDAGIVALLDKRAVTKGYGRRLLASLPPATRVHSLEGVSAFWAALSETLENEA